MKISSFDKNPKNKLLYDTIMQVAKLDSMGKILFYANQYKEAQSYFSSIHKLCPNDSANAALYLACNEPGTVNIISLKYKPFTSIIIKEKEPNILEKISSALIKNNIKMTDFEIAKNSVNNAMVVRYLNEKKIPKEQAEKYLKLSDASLESITPTQSESGISFKNNTYFLNWGYAQRPFLLSVNKEFAKIYCDAYNLRIPTKNEIDYLITISSKIKIRWEQEKKSRNPQIPFIYSKNEVKNITDYEVDMAIFGRQLAVEKQYSKRDPAYVGLVGKYDKKKLKLHETKKLENSTFRFCKQTEKKTK